MRPRSMRALAVALSTLATVGALLVAELALRAFAPAAPAGEGFAYAHRYSESLGWVPRPGVTYVERGVSYTLNAAGQRGALYPPGPHPGTTRVVLLGDSLTYGYGVAEEQTFPHLVDAARPDVEVVNLGVQGYGIDQSLGMLEERGMAYRPDLVVLDVCTGNDFLDDLLPWFLYDGRHPKPYYVLDGERLVRHDEHLRLSTAARLAQALREHSLLVDRLARLGGGDRRLRPEEILARPFRLPSGDMGTLRDVLAVPAERQRAFWHQASEVSFRLIAEIGRLARSQGADYRVLVFPSDPSHFEPDSWYDAELADARTRPYLRDVALVDVRAAFAQRGVGPATFSRFYLDTHCHLSPAGHQMAADLVGALLDTGRRGTH